MKEKFLNLKLYESLNLLECTSNLVVKNFPNNSKFNFSLGDFP
jgi:hypothetical protein